jgi:hypothetical protein
MVIPPILDNKHPSMPSVFAPAALLREARRQKGLLASTVPPVCILDPDGDLVRELRRIGAAKPFAGWPCYHTELDTFDLGGHWVGIVGRVVGASFAVLVAEELFASGCKLVVSLTSAGQIVPAGQPPYFVVIDRSLRDEGTSYHYAPPSEFAEAEPTLVKKAAMALDQSGLHGVVGGKLDHRRALSGNRPSHRGCAHQRHSCGRDGSGGPLHICSLCRRAHALPRACHKHYGPGR